MVDEQRVNMSRVPILVILGATGTGKSRLGIELAQRFSGEIISADSMQVYKGLNIVTAKVTKEEQKMAPHHLLDVADPLTNFTVNQFKDMALPILNDLLARKKMPIIVGGTNYYIESLLWQILLPVKKSSMSNDILLNERDADARERLKDVTSEELHRQLMEVDPEMAKRLHPRNRRKILRSLEVFAQHGVKHSEMLRAQRQAGESEYGGPLRYPNYVILWLRCKAEVLAERLNRRVDDMLEAGLIKELLDFHQRYNQERIDSNMSADYTKGIFQTIGFKEFHDYLILPAEERNSEKARKLLQRGIADLKLVTHRYAKRQEKWIKRRMIVAQRQVPPMYSLDCTDVQLWNSQVYAPAVAIISAIREGKKPEQKSLNEAVETKELKDNNPHYCETCERVFIGDGQWNAHIIGRRHRKVIKRRKLESEQTEAEEKKMNGAVQD